MRCIIGLRSANDAMSDGLNALQLPYSLVTSYKDMFIYFNVIFKINSAVCLTKVEELLEYVALYFLPKHLGHDKCNGHE